MLGWVGLFAGIGAAGTWLARRYALHRQLIDQPGERRSHTEATPRGGGIAIVVAMLIAAVALGLRQPLDAPLLAAFVVGLVMVAGIGWLDDHRPLSPWWRLLVHGLASALFALATASVFDSSWLGVGAFAAAMVLTNVWNFMDGINGIAASQAALVAGVLGWVCGGSWAGLGLALAAACLGFLPFNFPRARIFMGDVGSGAIGFALAALATVAAARLGSRSWLILLPLSPFLVDAGLTLLRRIVRGERWWTPHTQHAYQAWARKRGHAWVALAYVATTAVASALGLWLSAESGTLFIACIVTAWYICCAFFWRWLQAERL